MANRVLFVSAVFCGILHAIWMVQSKYHPILVFYIIGVITSLLNHGLTHVSLKVIDRLWMMFGTCLNLYYGYVASDYVAITCVVVYVVSYLLAKLYRNAYSDMSNVLQIVTHLFATYTNYRIGYWVANVQQIRM